MPVAAGNLRAYGRLCAWAAIELGAQQRNNISPIVVACVVGAWHCVRDEAPIVTSEAPRYRETQGHRTMITWTYRKGYWFARNGRFQGVGRTPNAALANLYNALDVA